MVDAAQMMEEPELVALLAGLVTQGLIPLPAFILAYDEHLSVPRQSPQFAVLAVTAGSDLQAVPSAVERALQDHFLADLWISLLGRSRGALFGNAIVEKITDAINSKAVGAMQRVLTGSGLRVAATLLDLVRAAGATARVAVDVGSGKSYGTGFLVGPDLLMTAAHVVAPLIEQGLAKPGSENLLSIEFFNQIKPWGSRAVRVRVKESWLEQMSPWHGMPPDLEAEDPAVSSQRLDFALIRLAEQGLNIEYLDIRNPPDPDLTERLAVIGYPGGTDCLTDDNAVLSYDARTGRVHHGTNAVAGMSGSPCLNRQGKAIAIHEGTVAERPPYNRAVHLKPVRAWLKRNGSDPLEAEPLPLWGLSDAEARREWITAGEALLGKTATDRQEWLQLAAPFNLATTDGAQAGDTFHPVFGRKDLQQWIGEALPTASSHRVALISGNRGTGKSFSCAILRTRLKAAGQVFAALPPAEVRVGSIVDVMKAIFRRVGRTVQPVSGSDGPRPQAGLVRRDILPDAFGELRKLIEDGFGPSAQLWVALDFGEESNLTPDMLSSWKDWLRKAEEQDWMRTVLIGLSAPRFHELAQELARRKEVFRDSLDPLKFEDFMDTLTGILQAVAPNAKAGDYYDRFYAYWNEVDPLSSELGRAVEAVRMALELRSRLGSA